MPKIAQDIEDKLRSKDVLIDDNLSFNSLFISEKILNALQQSGFRKPSPIQLKAIPLGKCGFDLVVKSKSGTGKTLIFTVVALESINCEKGNLQALILVPTREIAVQIQDVISVIGKNISGLKVSSFIGGLPVEEDRKNAKGCQIAVGCPGRIKQLIKLQILKTEAVRLFIVDEADKLMEESFINDINEIYNSLPERKQMIATSATYPNNLNDFISNYMISPTHISIELETPLLLGLKQYVKTVKSHSNMVQQMRSKNEELINLLTNINFTQCLVFSNYQSRAESISNILNQKGWNTRYISAAQSQNERLQAVGSLKEFKTRILLSTDLTARGIDASNVDLVINYDIPNDPMTYLHRMGRAGRYGAPGVCINLAFEGSELVKLQNILGCIAGAESVIPKLPEANSIEELHKYDSSTLDCIKAEVNDNFNIQSGDILNLKYEKQKGKKKGKNKSKSKTENTYSDKQIDKMDFQTTLVETTSTNISSNSEPDLDPKFLLQSMAEGKLPSSSLVSTIETDESKKRKRCNRPQSTDSDEKLQKNKGLLSVCKILSQSEKSEDDVASFDKLLTMLKQEENITLNNKGNAENMLKAFLNSSDNKEESLCETDALENIFDIAYKSAINNGKSWKSYFPVSEIEKFEKLRLKPNNYSDSDDENDSDEYYDEEMDENDIIEQQIIKINSQTVSGCTYSDYEPTSNPEVMKWVPVEKSDKEAAKYEPTTYFETNPQENCARYEQFGQYFNQCGENLWQNGLSFDNVGDFDSWFQSNWENQVLSVRNFVQQNIYIQEMSKVQEHIRNVLKK